MKDFFSKITMKQWIIIAAVIAIIVIIVLVAQNAKKNGQLASNKDTVIVNPYIITPYGQA